MRGRDPYEGNWNTINRAMGEFERRIGGLEAHVMATSVQNGDQWAEQQRSDQERYLNTILLIGYGGFFALWATTQSRLSMFWFGLIGLLVLLSLAVFLAWEVVKAAALGRAIGASQALDENKYRRVPPQRVPAFVEERTAWIRRLWPWQFATSAALASAALVLLVWQFAVLMGL